MENLGKTFGFRNKIRALDKVSFFVKKGTCTSLVGPNGAGKSTLLRIISGVVGRYQGKVSLNGKVSLSPEVSMNFPFMDAEENVSYFSSIDDGGKSPLDILKEVDLITNKQQAYSFSKGMKRKLDIARALSLGANSILMDEPFDGLDPGASDDLVNTINSLKRKEITFLISSHDLHRLTDISDNVIFLNRGQIAGLRDLTERNALKFSFAENTALAFDILTEMGCRITYQEESELHCVPNPSIKTWEIVEKLVSKGAKVTGVSNETLDSDYRRLFLGKTD